MLNITDIEVLDALVEFIKNNVSKNIKLKKPPSDNKVIDSEYELVNPAVFKGWVPPKNYNEEYGYDVPAIIAMLDEGTDDNEESDMSVRLKIVTYDPGKVKEDKTLSPNTEGYIDLLNVIQKIRREISLNPIIENKFSVKLPIKRSMDEEQSYPYWSADMSFSVSIAPFEFNTEEAYKKYL